MLGRVAPGRGTSISLYWAPPNTAPLAHQNLWYDELVVQVTGSRRWTVCRRGLSAEAIQRTRKAGGRKPCTDVVLRRGDALYLPSRGWHWTSEGAGPSAHLAWTFLPLVAVDFVVAAGAKARVTSGKHPMLGAPLPLWAHSTLSGAAEAVAAQCLTLPWLDPARDQAFCKRNHVELSLQRLAGYIGFAKDQPLRRARDRPAAGPAPAGGSPADLEFVLNSQQAKRRARRWSQNMFLLFVVFSGVLFLMLVFVCIFMFHEPRRRVSSSKKND
mmetsp:Transcript_62995/g.204206  ORF Transcript_62995/g.204206 Transcript_62995/m.204206 type:complete len:271 (+) Transcript_62995:731-1543(+)